MTSNFREVEEVFVKKHGVDVALDWHRVRLFAETIRCIDGVVTARPLWIERGGECIGYDRMTDLMPLLRNSKALCERFNMVGLLLARFHAVPLDLSGIALEFNLTDYPLGALGLNSRAAQELEQRLPTGMFYGDCWHGNVFERLDGTFVFLDPVPNVWIFEKGYLKANGAVDLAMHHMSLFFCHPITKLLASDPRQFVQAGHALIEGYLKEVGAMETESAILQLSRALACRYIAAYSQRLAQPIASVKQYISRRIVRYLDDEIAWNPR